VGHIEPLWPIGSIQDPESMDLEIDERASLKLAHFLPPTYAAKRPKESREDMHMPLSHFSPVIS